MKITVITPSVRPELLPIVAKCLSRQTFPWFDWIVVMPDRLHKDVTVSSQCDLLAEPPKREGDFYRLCGALNKAFFYSDCELVVVIMDGNWFKPDMLERFWGHYKASPKRLVTAVGDQFTDIDSRGEPQNLFWTDPRKKGSGFVKVGAEEMEFAVCSIPKQAIIDCGGFDEIWDTCPAVGEKEMCLRMSILGYEMYLDETIEYKAIHHPRLSSNWDEMYFKVTAPLFTKHVKELGEGTRPLKVEDLMRYNKEVNT